MLQPDQALFCGENEFIAVPLSLPLSDELQQKEALHTLGENAAAVLHELRGPLQAIRAHVQLLERKSGAGREAELARHFPPIYQGIDHVSVLLDEFLRLSRLAPTRLTQLDIQACVLETLPLLRSMAIMRNIELTTDMEQQTPPCQGNEQQLKRLLFNLFGNACDAVACRNKQNPPQQANIHLVLKRDGAAISMSVSDNGCGVSADKLEKIWQPFFTDKPAGTGLGLPSCLAIAQEHGGTLTVASQAGMGSRFTLRLPIRKAPVETKN